MWGSMNWRVLVEGCEDSRKNRDWAREMDCAAIPPLRNGKRRRCSGRDDRVKNGSTRQKAARKKLSDRSGRDDILGKREI